ncbi:malonate transporter subunit MadL [Flagellimonas zhangzhouensis]|uniref:Malonate transporter, MadL subunit n=1 Tax=Flagellimonas zhangzhouensis TaxID=1073328 RepID=A0A1H2YVR3_9FLAO|nr:malonate transporter subunit MadL [Allomuricauda zhangzhouensis]SDR05602.1 malonate transporter, MadL subunit [Allomuricauda zhangzhouensis]SDX09246.1 malonate transporter, MadL subunit [Allomuricauda zhangzhouensis]
MKIYGVALLAACFLLGKLLGRLLGHLLNINSDIGGVGFAMFLLMTSSIYLRKKKWLVLETEKGIWFWSAMYIPIIVAMTSTLNVKAALSGGVLAVVLGIAATAICMFMVPVISKIGREKSIDSQNK